MFVLLFTNDFARLNWIIMFFYIQTNYRATLYFFTKDVNNIVLISYTDNKVLKTFVYLNVAVKFFMLFCIDNLSSTGSENIFFLHFIK